MEIHIHRPFDADEQARLYARIYREALRPNRALAIAVAIVGLGGALAAQIAGGMTGLAVFLLPVGIYGLAMFRGVLSHGHRAVAGLPPAMQRDSEVIVTNDHLVQLYPSYTTEHRWEAFTRLVEIDTGWLLYAGRYHAIWIPTADLGPAEAEQLRSLLESRLASPASA